MNVDLIYCWFGGNPLPAQAQAYLETWRQQMPNTPIHEVNERNFSLTTNAYVATAAEQRKFAFVSDYARLAYLYEHGGIYLDTDVEMCRDLSQLVSPTQLVLSMEYFEWEITGVNTGTIIAPPKHPFIREVLATYENETFVDRGEATQTINQRMTTLLQAKGLQLVNTHQVIDDVCIYPYEYFCTPNPKAYTVHHYASSWQVKKSPYRYARRRIGKWLKHKIGPHRFAKIWSRK